MKTIRQTGFTLIELMIVLVVLAIIVTIGYPAYENQMMKSRRTQGQTTLQDYALLQEQYRANNPTYANMAELTATFGAAAADDWYNYTTSNVTASSYTLTATAQSPGAQDGDSGCTAITLDANNNKLPEACW